MKLGIMQPYFCAYIGYYQLIKSVDKFVVYDNIEFTKKGWFNRNRILLNDSEKLFTIPLKSASDYLDVNQRWLADSSVKDRKRILSQIRNSYLRAPYFDDIYILVEKLFLQENQNLFDFIYYSINLICEVLSIDTEIVVSSSINVNHNLKSNDKVLEICKHMGASIYINSPGGKCLYDKEDFRKCGVDLMFISPKLIEYQQFSQNFIPGLSMIDVLMFNGVEKTKVLLQEYDLE